VAAATTKATRQCSWQNKEPKAKVKAKSQNEGKQKARPQKYALRICPKTFLTLHTYSVCVFVYMCVYVYA